MFRKHGRASVLCPERAHTQPRLGPGGEVGRPPQLWGRRGGQLRGSRGPAPCGWVCAHGLGSQQDPGTATSPGHSVFVKAEHPAWGRHGQRPACLLLLFRPPPPGGLRAVSECVSSCLFRPQPRPHGPGTRGSLPPPAAPGLCGQGGSVHTRHLVSHRAGSSSGKLLTQGVWPWEGSRGRIRASRGAYWPRGPGPRPPPPVPLFLR